MDDRSTSYWIQFIKSPISGHEVGYIAFMEMKDTPHLVAGVSNAHAIN